MHAAAYLIIAVLSIAARVFLSGASVWALGRAMFWAGGVFLIASRAWWVVYEAVAYRHVTPAMTILALAESVLPLLALRWRYARYGVAVSLFWPGALATLRVVGVSWKYIGWEDGMFVITSLYAAAYLSALIAFSPCVTVYLSSPFRSGTTPGHCEGCGYDLRGNVSGRCPECGTEIDSKPTESESADSPAAR